MLKSIFSTKPNKEKSLNFADGVDLENIPQHIAIIMDGNGRWAKAQGKPRTFGHQAGAETLKEIVKAADAIGVKVISAYAFSTENWKRPEAEVSFIMGLLARYLESEIDEFNKNNVRVRFMGDRNELPDIVREKMQRAEAVTANNSGIILNLAINYGGQSEILQAVRMIANNVKSGECKVEDIDEVMFESNLYTKGLPAPDLLIRPGGDFRISNFMLWQIAYAEIWVTETYWPAFTKEMLLQAIKDYQGRERRYGGLVTK